MVAEPLDKKSPPSPSERPTSERLKAKKRGLFSTVAMDNMFFSATLIFGASVLVICVLIGIQLWRASEPAMDRFGAGFLTSSVWNPSPDDPTQAAYGAWPFIWGTLMSSLLALLLAVPIGLGTAIFLAELAPRWVRTPVSFMVELLAAVPSVVYGLWGRLVMVPWLQQRQDWMSTGLYDTLQGWEQGIARVPGLGWMGNYGPSNLVNGAPLGQSMMAGALILAIMVLPFITAVSREVIRAVPPSQREAAFGLGATRWEAIKGPVLRYARSGIIGAIILGLARALGETMAITMVIGNSDQPSISLLAPASTLSSKLANEFNEASGDQLAALMYLALVLFSITIIVNAFARFMIWNMARTVTGTARE